jgi:hypothetical protein
MSAITYQIRVKGHLSIDWAGEFEGMTLVCEKDGCTSLTGPLLDQAALFGFLLSIRDLGLELVGVTQVEVKKEQEPHSISQ